MKTPIRITLSRKQGFNLYEHSKSINGLDYKVVTRSSKWGNPFVLKGDMIYINAGYRRKTLSKWIYLCMGDAEKCVKLYECILVGIYGTIRMKQIGIDYLGDIEYWVEHFRKLDLAKLKDKNLACWCPENFKYCHADILLKFANE